MAKKYSLKIPLLFALTTYFIGAYFKISHYPYSKEILIISVSAILILYPIRYYLKQYKVFLDHIKFALVSIWSIDKLIYLFDLHIGFYQTFYIDIVVSAIVSILFIIWLFMEGIDYFNKNRPVDGKNLKKTTIRRNLFAISAMFVTVGYIFATQHYPGSQLLLFMGLGLGIIWFVSDYFL